VNFARSTRRHRRAWAPIPARSSSRARRAS
jgi:hypothetical protein